MPSDALEPPVVVTFALTHFADPDPDNVDPLSEELTLPESVTAAFDLAPTTSIVWEAGAIVLLIRRRSRSRSVEVTAEIEGGPDQVLTIRLRPVGSWLKGGADWPYHHWPTHLRLTLTAN